MKKIMSIIAIVYLFVSCSSDSSSSKVNNDIVGKWTVEKESIYSNSGTLISQINASDESCYHMTTYEYQANSGFIKVSYDYVTNNCVQNPTRTGTWSMTDDNLSVTVNGATDQLVVNSISTSTLKLKRTLDSSTYKITEYSKVN